MQELRDCKYQIKEVNLKGQLVTSRYYDGKFHQWGTSYEDCSVQGLVPVTVGIVEDGRDGQIHEVEPRNIRLL